MKSSVESPRIVSQAGMARGSQGTLEKGEGIHPLRDQLSANAASCPGKKGEEVCFRWAWGKGIAGDFRREKPADHLSLHVWSEWKERLPSCSIQHGSYDGALVHLGQRCDVVAGARRSCLLRESEVVDRYAMRGCADSVWYARSRMIVSLTRELDHVS